MDASESQIKRAYYKCARECHPDKGGDSIKFRNVSAAYEVLGDPARRDRYDNKIEDPVEPLDALRDLCATFYPVRSELKALLSHLDKNDVETLEALATFDVSNELDPMGKIRWWQDVKKLEGSFLPPLGLLVGWSSFSFLHLPSFTFLFLEREAKPFKSWGAPSGDKLGGWLVLSGGGWLVGWAVGGWLVLLGRGWLVWLVFVWFDLFVGGLGLGWLV